MRAVYDLFCSLRICVEDAVAAKRVIINRKEIELTDDEAKQFILDNVFTAKGVILRVENFASRALACGIEEGKDGDFERLINYLIEEGKVRIEYKYFHAGPATGYVLVIRRIV